jgi:hypothetical protein
MQRSENSYTWQEKEDLVDSSSKILHHQMAIWERPRKHIGRMALLEWRISTIHVISVIVIVSRI